MTNMITTDEKYHEIEKLCEGKSFKEIYKMSREPRLGMLRNGEKYINFLRYIKLNRLWRQDHDLKNVSFEVYLREREQMTMANFERLEKSLCVFPEESKAWGPSFVGAVIKGCGGQLNAAIVFKKIRDVESKRKTSLPYDRKIEIVKKYEIPVAPKPAKKTTNEYEQEIETLRKDNCGLREQNKKLVEQIIKLKTTIKKRRFLLEVTK